MKISIVTPCYNVAKYLPAFFDSIKKQTHKDFELICVDDGSSDNTWDMLEQFSKLDKRVIIYKMPQNSGGCKIPRDTAVRMATTDWIIRADADDFMEEAYIEKLLHRQQETQSDAVASCSIIYNETTSPHDAPTVPDKGFDYNQILSGRKCVMLTIGSWKISVSGLLIKRSIYTSCERFLQKKESIGKVNEDEYDMREMLTKCSQVAFVDAKYYYRSNPDSITHRSPERFLTHRTEEDVYKLISKNYGSDSDEAKIALAAYIRNIMRTLKKHKVYHPDVLAALKEISYADIMHSACPFNRKLMYIIRTCYYRHKFNIK